MQKIRLELIISHKTRKILANIIKLTKTGFYSLISLINSINKYKYSNIKAFIC